MATSVLRSETGAPNVMRSNPSSPPNDSDDEGYKYDEDMWAEPSLSNHSTKSQDWDREELLTMPEWPTPEDPACGTMLKVSRGHVQAAGFVRTSGTAVHGAYECTSGPHCLAPAEEPECETPLFLVTDGPSAQRLLCDGFSLSEGNGMRFGPGVYLTDRSREAHKFLLGRIKREHYSIARAAHVYENQAGSRLGKEAAYAYAVETAAGAFGTEGIYNFEGNAFYGVIACAQAKTEEDAQNLPVFRARDGKLKTSKPPYKLVEKDGDHFKVATSKFEKVMISKTIWGRKRYNHIVVSKRDTRNRQGEHPFYGHIYANPADVKVQYVAVYKQSTDVK